MISMIVSLTILLALNYVFGDTKVYIKYIDSTGESDTSKWCKFYVQNQGGVALPFSTYLNEYYDKTQGNEFHTENDDDTTKIWFEPSVGNCDSGDLLLEAYHHSSHQVDQMHCTGNDQNACNTTHVNCGKDGYQYGIYEGECELQIYGYVQICNCA